jgi:hypothetical protein
MTENRVIKGARELKQLAELLGRCADVSRYDDVQHKEAWALTHCFESLERHFIRFVDEQLPRLAGGELTGDEVCGLLYEIGADLQQIVYHIRQPRFYRYLDAASAQAP